MAAIRIHAIPDILVGQPLDAHLSTISVTQKEIIIRLTTPPAPVTLYFTTDEFDALVAATNVLQAHTALKEVTFPPPT